MENKLWLDLAQVINAREKFETVKFLENLLKNPQLDSVLRSSIELKLVDMKGSKGNG